MTSKLSLESGYSPSGYFDNAYSNNNKHQNDSDSDSDLPFPEPLSRSAFSSANPRFSPTEFLASLHNRHQSLEDLRLELRNRSRELERELVELVNRDYADFLGLGSSLAGGEGKVEDLRVGLLQLRREVEGLVGKLEGVVRGVEGELREREEVRRRKNIIRNLISISHRLDDLELSLLLQDPSTQKPLTASNNITTSLDASTSLLLDLPSLIESSEGLTSLPRLQRLKTSYLVLQHFISKIPKSPEKGEDHPFLVMQKGRIEKVRRTLLLDLGTALKEALKATKGGGHVGNGDDQSYGGNWETKRGKEKLLDVLSIFLDLGEEAEAVKILKELGGSARDISRVKTSAAAVSTAVTSSSSSGGKIRGVSAIRQKPPASARPGVIQMVMPGSR